MAALYSLKLSNPAIATIGGARLARQIGDLNL